MWLALILQNWRSILAVVIIAGASLTSYNKGKSVVQQEWDVDIAVQTLETLRITQENQKKITNLEVTKNENLNTIKNLHSDINDLRKRLRVPKPACPSQTDSTGGSIYESPTAGHSTDTTQEAFDRFTEGLGFDAVEYDRVMENCRIVMNWAASLPR